MNDSSRVIMRDVHSWMACADLAIKDKNPGSEVKCKEALIKLQQGREQVGMVGRPDGAMMGPYPGLIPGLQDANPMVNLTTGTQVATQSGRNLMLYPHLEAI